MTGSESTHYWILKKIFSNIKLNKSDSFIDIGCGKGRVLAFCVKEKYPCHISGIEINEVSGKVAQAWSEKYPNVNVIIGDAFQIDYSPYSVFFLGRPFLPKTFLQFLDRFESQVTHPVIFIYWVDQQSGQFLNGRQGWTMKKRKTMSKKCGIKIFDIPQGYSIWEYDPQQSKNGYSSEAKLPARSKLSHLSGGF